MTEGKLLEFLRTQRLAVQSSVSPAGVPQAALVGVAFSDQFEIVFDTLDSTRKASNLRANARAAFVIGGWSGGDERTVQYEGIADFPEGDELQRIREVYVEVFPDGRERLSWPGISHIRVRPSWIRYSDFNGSSPAVQEFRFPAS
jgi:general stress protein 26